MRAETAARQAQNPSQPLRAMRDHAEHGTEASTGDPVPSENGAADWSNPMPEIVTSVVTRSTAW